MKCREIEGNFPAYLAEEAAPELRRSIKAHLKGCKKCRARIAALKLERGGPKKEEAVVLAPEEVTPSLEEASATSPAASGILTALWRRPVEMTVTIVLIGGTLFLYHRGASDFKADFSITDTAAAPIAEAVIASAPAENHGGEPGRGAPTPPTPPPQTSPAEPTPLPTKAHQVTTQSLPKEARRKTTLSRPPEIKLLLISRDLQEAVDTVAAETIASQGKVLSKKGDEMETKMVLLVPAERYGTFSNSLQSVGLVKDVSKREPPSAGSVKIEVTIE